MKTCETMIMAKTNSTSLSTSDINRDSHRKDDDAIHSQYREFYALQKARLDRYFLPNYGDLWRQMIREKELERILFLIRPRHRCQLLALYFLWM